MSTPPHTSRFAWTAPQRRVLLVLLTIMLVFLAGRYACNSRYVSDPQPDLPPRYDELADRIDPNTADWQTLAALPGIGERRARDIVGYRERKRDQARQPDLLVDVHRSIAPGPPALVLDGTLRESREDCRVS